MYYCLKAAKLLKPLGIMAIVVPDSFLADEFLDIAKVSELAEKFSFLGQVTIQKDAFKSLGVENYGTKILFWRRTLGEEQGVPYSSSNANCFNLSNMDNTENLLRIVCKEIIEPAKEKIRENSSRVKLAGLKGHYSDFEYEVRRCCITLKVIRNWWGNTPNVRSTCTSFRIRNSRTV